MRELLELQTGQVAFISGLMSGFSLSVAVQILRKGARSKTSQWVFTLYLLASLLFLIALYVDVRLTIELAGIQILPESLIDKVSLVRNIGTTSASIALAIFVAATGLLGWLATRATGIFSTLIVGVVAYTFWVVWQNINTISLVLQGV